MPEIMEVRAEEASSPAGGRRLRAGGLCWNVREAGSGPALLLVHGTGSSSHSWRELIPALAQDFRVIAPDLPGHGLTDTPAQSRLSLPGMSDALAALLQRLDVRPDIVCGHSAGAAILIRMTLDGLIRPRVIVCINGALLPMRGMPKRLFTPVARALAKTDFFPRVIARRAAEGPALERLLADTGSHLTPAGIDGYRALVRQPKHVAAALGMMARWDLSSLQVEIRALTVPLVLVTGSNDRTVRPEESDHVQQIASSASRISLEGLGHLAHEERPDLIVRLIRRCAEEHGAAEARC